MNLIMDLILRKLIDATKEQFQKQITTPNDTQPDWKALEKLVSRRLKKEFMDKEEFSEKYKELDYSSYDNLETENNSNK